MPPRKPSRITAEAVLDAIEAMPFNYVGEDGRMFHACPVSQVSAMLRENGWRRVPRLDDADLRKLGLTVVTARYRSFGGLKKPCLVVAGR